VYIEDISDLKTDQITRKTVNNICGVCGKDTLTDAVAGDLPEHILVIVGDGTRPSENMLYEIAEEIRVGPTTYYTVHSVVAVENSHYVTYATRNFDEPIWYRFTSTHAKKVNKDIVLKTRPCVLILERRYPRTT
jgi:hypothetical protein